MLQLHKRYNIPATARITKKLTQQYIVPFPIVEKVGCLTYKFDIPPNWQIYQILSVAHLDPALPPIKDYFAKLFLFNSFLMFVKGNINKLKVLKWKSSSINAKSKNIMIEPLSIQSIGRGTIPNEIDGIMLKSLKMPPPLSRTIKRAWPQSKSILSTETLIFSPNKGEMVTV